MWLASQAVRNDNRGNIRVFTGGAAVLAHCLLIPADARLTAAWRAKPARLGLPRRKMCISSPPAQLATAIALLAGLATACGPASEESGSPASVPNPQPSSAPRCQAPPGVSAKPHSTDEAVQLLNALPKPTTVPCFLESLER